jgi:hypothetical protein
MQEVPACLRDQESGGDIWCGNVPHEAELSVPAAGWRYLELRPTGEAFADLRAFPVYVELV